VETSPVHYNYRTTEQTGRYFSSWVSFFPGVPGATHLSVPAIAEAVSRKKIESMHNDDRLVRMKTAFVLIAVCLRRISFSMLLSFNLPCVKSTGRSETPSTTAQLSVSETNVCRSSGKQSKQHRDGGNCPSAAAARETSAGRRGDINMSHSSGPLKLIVDDAGTTAADAAALAVSSSSRREIGPTELRSRRARPAVRWTIPEGGRLSTRETGAARKRRRRLSNMLSLGIETDEARCWGRGNVVLCRRPERQSLLSTPAAFSS